MWYLLSLSLCLKLFLLMSFHYFLHSSISFFNKMHFRQKIEKSKKILLDQTNKIVETGCFISGFIFIEERSRNCLSKNIFSPKPLPQAKLTVDTPKWIKYPANRRKRQVTWSCERWNIYHLLSLRLLQSTATVAANCD